MHPFTSLYMSLVTYTTETACPMWSYSMTMKSSNHEHKVRISSVLFSHSQLFFYFWWFYTSIHDMGDISSHRNNQKLTSHCSECNNKSSSDFKCKVGTLILVFLHKWWHLHPCHCACLWSLAQSGATTSIALNAAAIGSSSLYGIVHKMIVNNRELGDSKSSFNNHKYESM